MIFVLTPEEMRRADSRACEASGATALMRNAGARIAEYVRLAIPGGGRVAAFAGPGNNGGDAFAALAELSSTHECVCYASDTPSESVARADARMRATAAGVTVRDLPRTDDEARTALANARIALDGLFGTGSRLPIDDRFQAAVAALDRTRGVPIVALDIPSGIDALTGAVSKVAVNAGVTIALAAAKPGLLMEPAREHCGEIWLADIGIDRRLLAEEAKTFAAFDNEAFLQLLPRRSHDSDKRSSGAPLIFAGSEQFPGAAVLCTRGAARAGAGYVTVVTSSAAAPSLRLHCIEQVVVTIADGTSAQACVQQILEVAERNSSIAIGPGLGLDDRTGDIVAGLLERCTLPMVIDASGLFHLAKRLELVRGKPVVVTPHAGEFARLSGKGTIREGERVLRLREFVNRTGITTLLKGNDTLIYDGTTMHVNTTGTNALATAGTGDVLTGIIATLLSQGCSPFDAARLGAYWHGLAGIEAARERPVGTIAGDIPELLARALPASQPQSALRRIG